MLVPWSFAGSMATHELWLMAYPWWERILTTSLEWNIVQRSCVLIVQLVSPCDCRRGHHVALTAKTRSYLINIVSSSAPLPRGHETQIVVDYDDSESDVGCNRGVIGPVVALSLRRLHFPFSICFAISRHHHFHIRQQPCSSLSPAVSSQLGPRALYSTNHSEKSVLIVLSILTSQGTLNGAPSP